MQADDVLQRFVDVMGNVAKLVSVPQISTAVAVAGTVSSAVQTLVGVGNKQLVLGYIDSFVGADAAGGGGSPGLRSTYIALINAPAGTYDPKQLWADHRKLLHGPNIESARELSGVDYMLIQLEIRRERDDWDQLTSISEPFSKAIEALGQLDPATGEPKLAEADAFVRSAAVAALNSPDLTAVDRMRVARAIRKRFTSYREALEQERAARAISLPRAPTILDVAESARGMSREEVTVQELFRD
jgi:hypothetical protein